MPSYNSEKYIAASIESIRSQTYKNWELLITDDYSLDTTIDIIKNFLNLDARIKLFSLQRNKGTSYARNISLEHARGRFIAFCDSDDLWLPNKLQEQLSFMITNKYYFTFTAYDRIDSNSFFINKLHIPSKVSYIDLLKTCSIGCLTVIYDTEYLGKHYFIDLRKRQDYVLWLSFLKIIPFAFGLDIPLAKYRVHNSSISSNKLNSSLYQWKVYREIEKLNFLKCIFYFINYSINGFRKSF